MITPERQCLIAMCSLASGFGGGGNNDLSECRKRLFVDLLTQFMVRYEQDSEFKETIDVWTTKVKMDIGAPILIEKLCKEADDYSEV